jgi:hypothetical protein
MVTVPPVVYHYTDARAFEAILKNDKLWATDLRYLNDSLELGFRLEGLHLDADAPRKLTQALEIIRNAGAKSAFEAMCWAANMLSVTLCSFASWRRLVICWAASTH